MKGFTSVIAASAALLTSVIATPTNPHLVPRASASATSSGKLPAVSVQGNAFFADGKRFYIRGVDYQPGGSSNIADPIADVNNCTRDIPEFQKLGINTVRIYTVDNSANHDECMNKLADAGIYLALDVNSPKYSLRRDKPAQSYNDAYLQNIFATIDAFSKYSNTLLFFSGNEVINDDTTTNCAPYVKAVTRDMKSYIASRGYRKIPVGYSAADVDSNRFEMAQYMNCGTNDERSDFFAFNDYSWCDPSDYKTAGWDKKVAQYSNYSIPLFLSEYGCNTNKRQWQEVSALYDPKMTGVYSGGLVYEYSEEGSKYGLVQIDGNTVTELDDFTALQTALKNTPAPTGDGGYSKSGAASTCPAKSSTWDVSTDALPAIPDKAKEFFNKGAGTAVGLTGDGSQDASGQSTGTATAGSGMATSTGSTTAASASKSTGAAASLRVPDFSIAPLMCGLVVVMSTFMGAALL